MTTCKEITLKLHIGKSRIWNMGMKNVKRHSHMMVLCSLIQLLRVH